MVADVIPRVYGSAVEETIHNFILLAYVFSLSKFILFSKPCHIKLTTTNKISLYVSTVKVQNKIKLVLVALEISSLASSLWLSHGPFI